MKYKKEHIKSNGRKLVSGGPRDLQRRQQLPNIDQDGAISDLKNEIQRLAKELSDRPVIGGYTGEQMDDEIRSAVTNAVKDLKKEAKHVSKNEENLRDKLNEKEKELEKAREEVEKLLKEHNEKLEQLIMSGSGNGDLTTYENDRPQMQPVFIDPLEEGAGKELEPFLEVKDISKDDKENMFDKVDKLKGMLGKLPTKK